MTHLVHWPDSHLVALYTLLVDRYGSYSHGTDIFMWVLLELHRRRLLILSLPSDEGRKP
jgi:hypothetical protein